MTGSTGNRSCGGARRSPTGRQHSATGTADVRPHRPWCRPERGCSRASAGLGRSGRARPGASTTSSSTLRLMDGASGGTCGRTSTATRRTACGHPPRPVRSRSGRCSPPKDSSSVDAASSWVPTSGGSRSHTSGSSSPQRGTAPSPRSSARPRSAAWPSSVRTARPRRAAQSSPSAVGLSWTARPSARRAFRWLAGWAAPASVLQRLRRLAKATCRPAASAAPAGPRA